MADPRAKLTTSYDLKVARDRMTNVNWYYHWTCASARRRKA